MILCVCFGLSQARGRYSPITLRRVCEREERGADHDEHDGEIVEEHPAGKGTATGVFHHSGSVVSVAACLTCAAWNPSSL